MWPRRPASHVCISRRNSGLLQVCGPTNICCVGGSSGLRRCFPEPVCRWWISRYRSVFKPSRTSSASSNATRGSRRARGASRAASRRALRLLGVGSRPRGLDMTEHSIAASIQDAHGCENVSNNALCLWDNPNALYSSRHASADRERELGGFLLLAKVQRILTDADITQIRRDARCARQLLFRWKLWEAYEQIDR